MATNENISDEPILDASRKKKSKKRTTGAPLADTTVTNAPTQNIIQEDNGNAANNDGDYTYDYLLSRIHCNDVPSPLPTTNRVPVPQLARIGTQRTSLINFALICKVLRRDEKQLYDYFTVELATTASIDGNHALIIRGRYRQAQIETVLRSFLRGYVVCRNCHSMNTWLGKSERLTVIRCAHCKSQYCVSSIRPHGQLHTGRRSNDTT